MTRPAQKDAELKAVLALQAVYAEFPDGEAEVSEDPLDVKVKLRNGRCLGIEVTDFARDRSKKGSLLNSYQELTTKIAAESEAVYRASGSIPVYASLCFGFPIRCGSKDVSSWAKQISAQVGRVASSATMPIEIHGWEAGLPSGVEKIVVYPIGGMPVAHFAPMYAGAYGNLTAAHVETILADKEPSVPVYRQKCDEVWLLILVHGMKLSGWAELSAEAQSRTYGTSFDRVLLLFDHSKVVRLRTGA